MLNSENTIKTTAIYYHNQLFIFYWRVLPYNFIVGSYDRIQHVITMDLNLVQFYLNMCALCLKCCYYPIILLNFEVYLVLNPSIKSPLV